MSVLIPKLGYYRNNATGEVFLVDYVCCGQNEIYGECNGVKVISDYNTKDEFEYLGLTKSYPMQ